MWNLNLRKQCQEQKYGELPNYTTTATGGISIRKFINPIQDSVSNHRLIAYKQYF